MIFPSFSHSAHVASNADDPEPGWWEQMVGPGRPIDTNHFRVLCLSVLGSPFGPTSPLSVNPKTGNKWGAAFPTLTPTDLARCHAAVLSELGIRDSDQVHAVVGSSLGGMQALQFASLFPERVARVAAVACTGRTTPFSVGVRHLQRKAILDDPDYRGGRYLEEGTPGPVRGLQLARQIGTLFYRSRQEFDARFDWSPTHGDTHWTAQDTFEVENYLLFAGKKAVVSEGGAIHAAALPFCEHLLLSCILYHVCLRFNTPRPSCCPPLPLPLPLPPLASTACSASSTPTATCCCPSAWT